MHVRNHSITFCYGFPICLPVDWIKGLVCLQSIKAWSKRQAFFVSTEIIVNGVEVRCVFLRLYCEFLNFKIWTQAVVTCASVLYQLDIIGAMLKSF